MKLKIWSKEQKEEEQPLRLRLVADGRSIVLNVVNKDGMWITSLLKIDAEGLLHLHEGVDDDLGLCLNKDGKLKVGKAI